MVFFGSIACGYLSLMPTLASVVSSVPDLRVEADRNALAAQGAGAMDSHPLHREAGSGFVDIFGYSVGGFANASHFENHGKR